MAADVPLECEACKRKTMHSVEIKDSPPFDIRIVYTCQMCGTTIVERGQKRGDKLKRESGEDDDPV